MSAEPGAEAVVEEYFTGLMDELQEYALEEARPQMVMKETKRRERSLTSRALSGALSAGPDRVVRFVKGKATEVVEDVAGDVIEQQMGTMLDAARSVAEGSGEGAYEREKERFEQQAYAWVDELNAAARDELGAAIADGFEDITDSMAYFLEEGEGFEGESFAELVAAAPREEAAEQLYALAEYVGELQDAFKASGEVYATEQAPVVGEMTFYFRREAFQLAGKAETYLREEFDRVLDEAYES